VKPNPIDSTTQKSLKSTSWNQMMSFPVTLPAGRVLADYDKLFFEDYFPTSTIYAAMTININGTTPVYSETGYPGQGSANTWLMKTFDLNGLAGGNSFILNIGINNNIYYLDNIKLRLKSVAVTITTPTNGTLVVMNGATQVNSGDLIPIGTDLTVTATPNSGYQVNGLTANAITIANGGTYNVAGATTFAATIDLGTGVTETSVSKQLYCDGNTIKLGQVVNQADVYDVNGRLLVTLKNASTINVANFGHGIYVVKTLLNGKLNVSKVSK
jgi:hypothetical protein